MMCRKFITVTLVTLCLSAVAVAREEKFEENYKVEGAVKTERQIASEKESDREPSSVAPVVVDDAKFDEAPQPWLHKVDGATH